jgi:hypothetical protein
VSGNIGFWFNNALLNDRMTLAAGWFNDWFTQSQSFSESANIVAAHITGLPIYEDNGRRFIHRCQRSLLRSRKMKPMYHPIMLTPKQFKGFRFEQLWSINNFSLLGDTKTICS